MVKIFFLITTFSLFSVAKIYFDFNDESVEVGQKKRIQILYSYNSAQLINSKELDSIFIELSNFLKIHSNVKIEIGGHTDCRGSAFYNKKLSEHRARSAQEYIIKKYNIDSAQLTYIGYGEDAPTHIDAELHSTLSVAKQKLFPIGTVLTESFINGLDNSNFENAHHINRRTELKIVSVSN